MKTFVSNNHKYHYYMWRWLARNPKGFKPDWPGFKKIEKPMCCCFACETAAEKSKGRDQPHCFQCPITEWFSTSENDLVKCIKYGSPFILWSKNHNNKVAALQISELEWEE